ncbi:MAG: hypothetical protein J0I08_22470 [Rhizobiales bacterium]|jgi:hypothetical protein|nr:hypothetical protein [Hyphomicrobiales bacterium]
MTASNFSHLVEIDEDAKKLKIFRVFDDGKKQFYTEVDFPNRKANDGPGDYEGLMRMLGENILLDSPAARRLMAARQAF